MDVAALLGRYTLEQLCELAAEKDAGFDRRVFAEALVAAAAHSDAAVCRNSAWGRQLCRPTGEPAGWRTQLLDAADMSTTVGAVRRPTDAAGAGGFRLDQRSATI